MHPCLKPVFAAAVLALGLLAPGPAAAVSLNDWLARADDARGFYLAGVLDSLIYDRDRGARFAECVSARGIDGASRALVATAAENPALGGFNAAGLVAIAAEAECPAEAEPGAE